MIVWQRLICCIVLGTGLLMAAEGPPRRQWENIEQRLCRGDDSALPLVQRIQQHYPDWPGAALGLADYHLVRKEYKQALQWADEARGALPQNARPVAQILQALIGLKRWDDCWTLFGTYRQLDTDGSLHHLAALGQLGAGNLSQAAKLSREALALASAQSKPGFLLTDARIAVLDNRLTDAERRLLEVCQLAPGEAACWYNLGLVRYQIHQQLGGDYIHKAHEDLQKAQELAATNGQVTLAAGLIAAQAGENQEARRCLDLAGRLLGSDPLPELAQAGVLLNLGVEQADRSLWQQATSLLGRLDISAAQRDVLINNRLAANIAVGEADEVALRFPGMDGSQLAASNRALAAWITAHVLAQSEPERALTMTQQAIADFTTLAEGSTDPIRRPHYQRFLGHAQVLAGELFRRQQRTDESVAAFDQAADAYIAAAEAGDRMARRHYLAVASQRDAATAYAAGVYALRWGRFDPSAWQCLLANYGASEAWMQPVHLGVWGIVLILSLVLALRRHKPTPATRRPVSGYRRQPSGYARQPSSAGGRRPSSRRPGSATKRPVAGANETLLPGTMAPRTAPLEKSRRKKPPSTSSAPGVKADETLLPQTMTPQQRKRDRALDAKRRSRD